MAERHISIPTKRNMIMKICVEIIGLHLAMCIQSCKLICDTTQFDFHSRHSFITLISSIWACKLHLPITFTAIPVRVFSK